MLATLAKGKNAMKRLLLALVLVCTLLVTASVPALATTPTVVSGRFDYEYVCDMPGEMNGGNLFLHCTDIEYWEGDLVGIVMTEYWVLFHTSGVATFSSKGLFEGSVLGSDPGTLEFRGGGVLKAGAAEWQGVWSLGHGTDGLEDAHAEGTWHGPENVAPLYAYDGKVHFE